MTPCEMLDVATRDFEATFGSVRLGEQRSDFKHNGKFYRYVVVSGDGPVEEGCLLPVYDSAEDAISALRQAWKSFEGRRFLYWRIRPEIAQDENEKDFLTDGPNPNFGKWKTYSRFRAID